MNWTRGWIDGKGGVAKVTIIKGEWLINNVEATKIRTEAPSIG